MMAVRRKVGDTIVGTDRGDEIAGDDPGRPDLGPDDRILGGDGGDAIWGDTTRYVRNVGGDDTLDGGLGSDWIAGGAGSDIISGGSGDDSLRGQSGTDILYGSQGNDTLEGGSGADVIIGGTTRDGWWGRDVASYETSTRGVTVDLSTGEARGGDAAGDRLHGISSIFGSRSNDVLVGDDRDNWLRGDVGSDLLVGGGGNDTIQGARSWYGEISPGRDTLTGGAGADAFVVGETQAHPSGNDSVTITDFTPAEGDRLWVNFRTYLDSYDGYLDGLRTRQVGPDVAVNLLARRYERQPDDTYDVVNEEYALCTLLGTRLGELSGDWWKPGTPDMF